MTSFALIGSTGEAWSQGIGVYGLMASWSGIIHSACFFLIGVKLWHLGKEYGYTTQIQFFRDRFQSPGLGLLLFPILVGLVVPYVIINILGAGSTMLTLTAGALPQVFPATGGAVPQWLGSGVVCVVVLVYVFGGGARSTAWANVAQTLAFMFIGLLALGVIAFKLGGPVAASQAVAEAHPELLVRGAAGTHEGHFTHLEFLTYAFVPLSVAMFPHLFQNWMTARSAKAFRVTVMLHPVFIMLVWAPCILLGIWASAAIYHGQPVIPPAWSGSGARANAVLGTMVNTMTDPLLGGLMAVGILASSLALDSQFLAMATMFTHDIVVHYFGKERFDDKRQVLLARSFVLVIVVVAYALSLAAPRSVFTLGVWCFSGFSSLFPLIFASLYWKRVTKAGAFASILTAAAAWIAMYYASGFGSNRDYLFWGMMPVVPSTLASAAALVIVSLLTKPPKEEVLDRFFPRARPRHAATPSAGQRSEDTPEREILLARSTQDPAGSPAR
jgi:SSS family solute:Na+ symporter